jgi:Domain of unknown function (DUF1707)
MPTQSNPPRPRGLGPLLRGVGVGNSDQHLRVSDAERRAVADRLAEHFSEGRLDQAEFDERVGQAMNAKTRGDLRGLFDDLPEPGVPGVSPPPAPGRREGDVSPRGGRRHGYGNRLMAFALVVVITAAAAQTVVHMTVPWLWIGFLALAMLVATERANRSRADRSPADRSPDGSSPSEGFRAGDRSIDQDRLGPAGEHPVDIIPDGVPRLVARDS